MSSFFNWSHPLEQNPADGLAEVYTNFSLHKVYANRLPTRQYMRRNKWTHQYQHIQSNYLCAHQIVSCQCGKRLVYTMCILFGYIYM